MTSRGVIYVTSGNEFVEEATESAQWVKEHNPDLPVTLITDRTRSLEIFNNINIMDNPEFGFADKPKYINPVYERTLFLDTDVRINGSLDPVFDALEQFDIACCHNNGNHTRNTYENNNIPKTFPEFNTGVIGLRDSVQVNEFLSDWWERFESDTDLRPGDQPSFRAELYDSDMRVLTLPPEYNCLFRYPGHAVGEIVCYHGRLRQVDSMGAGLQYDAESAVKALSKHDFGRAFAPTPFGNFKLIHSRSTLHRLRTRFLCDGLSGVIQRAKEIFLN